MNDVNDALALDAPHQADRLGSNRPARWRCSAWPARSSSRSPPRRSCWRIALICWIALLVVRRERFEAPRFFWPLLAYGGATLVSAALSPDPRTSLIDCKQLVLFLLVPLVYRFVDGARAAHAADRRGDLRRGQRGVRHRAVRHPALRQPRPAAAGHARPLDDLLRPADARHRRRDRAGALRQRAIARGRRWCCRRSASRSR